MASVESPCLRFSCEPFLRYAPLPESSQSDFRLRRHAHVHAHAADPAQTRALSTKEDRGMVLVVQNTNFKMRNVLVLPLGEFSSCILHFAFCILNYPQLRS